MFSVSQAAILLEDHPATIRRWNRHRTIRCSRTPGGHRRIADARKDILHKMTTAMANNNVVIVIEDLVVNNMMM